MRTELYHYGVKGMRWGHRKARYSSESAGRSSKSGSSSSGSGKKKMSTAKKVAIGAAIVGGTMLVAYGGYKLSQNKYETLKVQEAVNKALSSDWRKEGISRNRKSTDLGLKAIQYEQQAKKEARKAASYDKDLEKAKENLSPRDFWDAAMKQSRAKSWSDHSELAAEVRRNESLAELKKANKAHARADYYKSLSEGYRSKADKTLYGKIQKSRNKRRKKSR